MTVFLGHVTARDKQKAWKHEYQKLLGELRQHLTESKAPPAFVKRELEQVPPIWLAQFEDAWDKFEILARIEQMLLFKGGYSEADVEELYGRLTPKLHLIWDHELERLESQLKELVDRGELYESVLQAIIEPYTQRKPIRLADAPAYIASLRAEEARLKAIVDALPPAQIASGALNQLSLRDSEVGASSSSKDDLPSIKRSRPSSPSS